MLHLFYIDTNSGPRKKISRLKNLQSDNLHRQTNLVLTYTTVLTRTIRRPRLFVVTSDVTPVPRSSESERPRPCRTSLGQVKGTPGSEWVRGGRPRRGRVKSRPEWHTKVLCRRVCYRRVGNRNWFIKESYPFVQKEMSSKSLRILRSLSYFTHTAVLWHLSHYQLVSVLYRSWRVHGPWQGPRGTYTSVKLEVSFGDSTSLQ